MYRKSGRPGEGRRPRECPSQTASATQRCRAKAGNAAARPQQVALRQAGRALEDGPPKDPAKLLSRRGCLTKMSLRSVAGSTENGHLPGYGVTRKGLGLVQATREWAWNNEPAMEQRGRSSPHGPGLGSLEAEPNTGSCVQVVYCEAPREARGTRAGIEAGMGSQRRADFSHGLQRAWRCRGRPGV